MASRGWDDHPARPFAPLRVTRNLVMLSGAKHLHAHHERPFAPLRVTREPCQAYRSEAPRHPCKYPLAHSFFSCYTSYNLLNWLYWLYYLVMKVCAVNIGCSIERQLADNPFSIPMVTFLTRYHSDIEIIELDVKSQGSYQCKKQM